MNTSFAKKASVRVYKLVKKATKKPIKMPIDLCKKKSKIIL